MTHPPTPRPTPPLPDSPRVTDPRDAEVALRLDALAQHDAGTMPTGLADRVLASTPAPVAGSAEPEVRTFKFTAFQRTMMGLAAAAALTMLMLPVWMPKKSTTAPITTTAYDLDEVDLFEMTTSALATQTDLDSLFEDATSFDPEIEPDEADWFDETGAL